MPKTHDNTAEEDKLLPTYCGKSKIPLGAKVKIFANTHGGKSDNLTIGYTGIATHPFAFGCTDTGWIGIWLDKIDKKNIFKNQMNCHESEVKIISSY